MKLRDMVGKTVVRAVENEHEAKLWFSDGTRVDFGGNDEYGVVVEMLSRADRIARWLNHRRAFPQRLRDTLKNRALVAEFHRAMLSGCGFPRSKQ